MIRVAGTDQFGNPIVADRGLEISGKADATRLRLLTDRQSFKVGESASINLHSRSKPGTALLAWEADRILQYKLVPIKEGDNPVTWAVDGPQFPNFTLTASRMADDKFDVAALDIRVERDLRVTIKPLKPIVEPGQDVEVEVTTVDQLDRPVAAEVALALVDRSLLRLFNDKLPPIGPYFYDQTRTGAFSTEATNTFRDEPTTMPVSEAVVEEQERLLAQTRNGLSRGEVMEEAKAMAKSEALRRPSGSLALVRWREPAERANEALGMIADQSAGPRLAAPSAAPRSAPMSAEGRMGGAGGGFGGGEPGAARKRRTMEATGCDAGFVGRSYADDCRRRKIRSWPGWYVPEGNTLRLFERGGRRSSDKAGPGRCRGRRPASRAVRRDRLLEPRRGHRQGRQGDGQVQGPDGPVGIPLLGQGGDGVRHPGRPGDLGLDRPQGLLRRPQGPGTLTQGDKPRFSAEVHHVGIKGAVEVRLAIYSGEREQVYPRTLDLKADGVEEILFEPFEVPDGESVRLTLTAKAGEKSDELVLEVPIRPWGVQAFASASGTSSNDATVFVGLPTGRTYESPEMRIDVSPTLRRLLIELALGRDFSPLTRNASICWPIPPDTIADRASDLIAATSALAYLREARTPDAPEAARLAERIQGLVAELVTNQNDDGGWSWVAPPSRINLVEPAATA